MNIDQHEFKSNFGIYCLKTDNVGSPLTDFVKNTATKEPKTEQGRSRRQLFHPFGDSSVRHNKQRGSALKFPHTPFQSSDIKLKHAQNHAISFPVFRVRSAMQNSVFLHSVYFCWSGLL